MKWLTKEDLGAILEALKPVLKDKDFYQRRFEDKEWVARVVIKLEMNEAVTSTEAGSLRNEVVMYYTKRGIESETRELKKHYVAITKRLIEESNYDHVDSFMRTEIESLRRERESVKRAGLTQGALDRLLKFFERFKINMKDRKSLGMLEKRIRAMPTEFKNKYREIEKVIGGRYPKVL
ncbi:MAG: hypothetical protein WC595_00155 [Candidatus Nanoarchaeia archaeon]